MEAEQSSPYLDVELLQGYLDSLGKTIVVQMLTLYCQQVEIYLNDIECAQRNDSHMQWQEHCHKMKGAAASVGMLKLHGHLKLLEKTTASQQQKLPMLTELKLMNEQGVFAFKQWLESM